MNMNEVNIGGRISKKIELKTIKLKNGLEAPCVNFDLAITEMDRTSFISCVALNKNAINLEKFTDKGLRVGITGSLSTNLIPISEERKVKVTSVFVKKVHLIDYVDTPETENVEKTIEQEEENLSMNEGFEDIDMTETSNIFSSVYDELD